MKYSRYLALLVLFSSCSSLILGVILGLIIVLGGGFEAAVDLTFEFSSSDGFWVMLAVPVLVTSIFMFLSPLSYFFQMQIAKKFGGSKSD